MAERLTDTLTPWFAEAFTRHALGERITWDLILGAQSGPGGGAMPVLLVYASIPSATLGDTHLLFAQMGGLGVTQEIIEREVRVLVDKLFEIRTQAMFQGNGRAPTSMPWRPPEG